MDLLEQQLRKHPWCDFGYSQIRFNVTRSLVIGWNQANGDTQMMASG